MLIDFWFLLKDIRRAEQRRISRSRSLKGIDDFCGTCERIESYCIAQMMIEIETRKHMRSVDTTEEERNRLFMKSGGDVLPSRFPCCPMCKHGYVDQPPINKIIERNNKIAMDNYIAVQQHLQDYKDDKRNDAPKDAKGKEIKKLSAPTTKEKLIRCHCMQFHYSTDKHQNVASKCPIDCTNPTTGKRYGKGKCYSNERWEPSM